MKKAEDFIKGKLAAREANHSIRKLSTSYFPIDFSSNDYLGFAKSEKLKQLTLKYLSEVPNYKNGSGGSRLLSGNHVFTEATEAIIASFHQAESGLLFNSGYDANIGLLSAIAQRGDTIITDELIHASLIDGARLSHANRYTFKHNSLNDLEAKLKAAKGNLYVVIESVYSMDGDVPPLKEISELCKIYGAALIVDEAHALGIFGDYGAGLVQQLKLQEDVFARIVTFGKGLGVHGAVVLGSSTLRSYLINFSRSFIYTTAAPLHAVAAIRSGYHLLQEQEYNKLIQQKINYYTTCLQNSSTNILAGISTIQTVSYPGNSIARRTAEILQLKDLDVRPILNPTVPEGKERIRICLHLFNTEDEIKLLVDTLLALEKK